MSVFGERLKELRKKHKLTQPVFAKKINAGKSTVAMWETGDRHPDHDTIRKIAAFFSCTSDYLLGLSDHPHYTAKEQEEKLDPDIFEKLVEMYKEGRLTKEDMDKINEYAEFVTSNKKK